MIDRARSGSPDRSRELDAALDTLARQSLTVPIAKEGGAAERERLVAALRRGDRPSPRPIDVASRAFGSDERRLLAHARSLAGGDPLGPLYLKRLEEIELDFLIREARADLRRLRPLLAQRYGTGREHVASLTPKMRLIEVAEHLLNIEVPPDEEALLPPEDIDDKPSVAFVLRNVAAHAGITLAHVRVDEDLVANALAVGTDIRIADRFATPKEALRCAVHEVLGHLVATHNALRHDRSIFMHGTASALEDQEGVALVLEEQASVLDARRLRVLGARVVATTKFHEGARYEDVAIHLHRDCELSAEEAIAITERTFRGGGTAREAVYLRGFLRVRAAIANGSTTIDEMRNGKIAIAALGVLRSAIDANLVHPATHRPTLESALSFLDRRALGDSLNIDALLENRDSARHSQ